MTSMSDQELRADRSAAAPAARAACRSCTDGCSPARMRCRSVAANRPTGRARRAGVITAITALIGAGGFTTYSFLGASNDGGAATPEEAVTTFVSAMEHEDVLGMIDVTLPEEVGALRVRRRLRSRPMPSAVDLLADDFDISGVQGLDVSVDDLVLETNFLEGGLAAVTATSGTFNAAFDPRAFPFGDKLRQLLGETEQVDTATLDARRSEPPALLMTVEARRPLVRQPGVHRCRVRAPGSRAGNSRSRQSHAGRLRLRRKQRPPASTSGSLRSTLQAAIDTFAPGEDAMAWLAQAWIADAQAAIEQGRADGWSVGISGLTYETIGSGDRVTLEPVTFKVEGTVAAVRNDRRQSERAHDHRRRRRNWIRARASRGNALDHRRAQLHRQLPRRR